MLGKILHFNMQRALAGVFSVILLTAGLFLNSQGCVSARETFMMTSDPYWQAWMDEKVDINIENFPLWRLRDLSGFSSGNYYLDGQTAGGVLVHIKASKISRRDVFWGIHKQTGLLIDFVPYQGTKVIRFRSKQIAELKGD